MEAREGPSGVDSKLGQLFMAGIPGTHMDEGTEALIREHHIGGFVFFSRNIEDPLQLTRLCADLHEAARKQGSPPLFMAVDQEGGRVARLGEPFSTFPGNESIGRDHNPVDRAIEFGRTTAKELAMVGLNMNFAPVVDVQRGALEKHLVGRTFGEDPEKVALLGKTVIKSLQENGVMAVAKHFPGLGRATLDPHIHLPRIEADIREIEETNLPPFKAAIEEGVSAIMTSHAIYPALDGERPATLSPAVLIRLLRNSMKFEGLIITDDLEMGAVAAQWGVARGAAAAFEAGADIMLICKEQNLLLESLQLAKEKLSRGEIPSRRLDESSERIRKVKRQFLGPGQKPSPSGVEAYFKL